MSLKRHIKRGLYFLLYSLPLYFGLALLYAAAYGVLVLSTSLWWLWLAALPAFYFLVVTVWGWAALKATVKVPPQEQKGGESES